MLGQTEWIVIGTVAVLLFGAPQILKWARALGQAKREFKEATKEIEEPKQYSEQPYKPQETYQQ